MFARRIQNFLQQDYAVGVLLFIAATLAMLVANTGLAPYYNDLLEVPVRVMIGPLDIHKPLLLWINDGLMAVFFLLVGLEVKHEILEGELRNPAQVALPGIAALGGMLMPALIYTAVNYQDPIALNGWAIPAATDIAFAVGILALLGPRVPPSLKTFLLVLAIIDDLGAIIIIALFYTEQMSFAALGFGSIFLAILAYMNYRNVTRLSLYLLVGTALWVCVLKSGVHATLAGVLLAFTIPLKLRDRQGRSPAKALQHQLHSKVNYVILPIFAFTNAGLSLGIADLQALFTPVPMGVMFGLFLGKQVGVFSFSWLAIKSGLAKLPNGANWIQMYGIAILCGVGFTMSLFIAGLAFNNLPVGVEIADRIGVLSGSILSAVVGFSFLYWASEHIHHVEEKKAAHLAAHH